MLKRYNNSFLDILGDFNFEVLENSKNTIYALSKDLKFIYFNPAWFQLAEENGLDKETLQKYQLGTPISKAIHGLFIRSFYKRKFRKIIASSDIWHHDYECSSSKKFRYYHQSVYPLMKKAGILVINSVMFKLPMSNMNRETFMAIEGRYINSDGRINICANCRHTQRADQLDIWDWVPEWREKLPANHSLFICPTCEHLYKED